MMATTIQERLRDNWLDANYEAADTIDAIKAALNTEEDGDALVEVARNAHKAELVSAFRDDPDTIDALVAALENAVSWWEKHKDDIDVDGDGNEYTVHPFEPEFIDPALAALALARANK